MSLTTYIFGVEKLIKKLVQADSWLELYQSEFMGLNLSPKKLLIIGREFYKRKLNIAIADLVVSEQEKIELKNIANTFKLDSDFIKSCKALASKKALKKLIELKYSDGILTNDKKTEIFSFASFLGMPELEVEKIRLKIAGDLFNTEFNKSLEDKKLSPAEETELNQLLRNLDIDSESAKSIITSRQHNRLAYARLLWKFDNGLFDEINEVPINLKRDEICYLAYEGKRLESKVVTTGYTTGSQGVSIRIAKGLHYRVGAAKSTPIREQVTLKHPGILYLTNNRVVFTSTGKNSFTMPFDKLLSFNAYSDGIGLILDGKSIVIELESNQAELFAVALTSAIRNYMDGSNTMLQTAKTEIEQNETFLDYEVPNKAEFNSMIGLLDNHSSNNTETNEEAVFESRYKKPKILQIFKWTLSVLFIVMALFAMFKDHLVVSGVSFLLLGLILMPAVFDFLIALIPVYNKRVFRYSLYIIVFFIAASGLPEAKNRKINTSADKPESTKIEKYSSAENNFPKLIPVTHEIVQGNKISKVYYYGLYLKIQNDTVGSANAVMNFLDSAAQNIEEHDVVHLWVFTDSSIIPKTFNGEWSSQLIRSKCYAHAARLANGYSTYDFDIFASYK